MQLPWLKHGAWLVPVLAASISCGRTSPGSPTPTPPSPTVTSIMTRTICLGTFHPGDAVPGGCSFEVGGGAEPPVSAFADLRRFGGPAEAALVRCPACGAPPWTFDVDVRIPADTALGPLTVDLWAIDARGQRAATTATFQVTAR